MRLAAPCGVRQDALLLPTPAEQVFWCPYLGARSCEHLMSSCRGTSSLFCKMQLWWLSGHYTWRGEQGKLLPGNFFLLGVAVVLIQGHLGPVWRLPLGRYAAWLGHVGPKLLLTWHGMPIRWWLQSSTWCPDMCRLPRSSFRPCSFLFSLDPTALGEGLQEMLVSVLVLLTLFLPAGCSSDSVELHPSCHSGQRLQQVTGLLVLVLAMREAWFGCLYF